MLADGVMTIANGGGIFFHKLLKTMDNHINNRVEAHKLFEEFLPRCPALTRQALIDVCDTMEICRLWFESRGVRYTGGDLVQGAALVLKREQE